ncbi:MAG: InlB B-repeat-containing protein, partial [Limisphaerales bacterium]
GSYNGILRTDGTPFGWGYIESGYGWDPIPLGAESLSAISVGPTGLNLGLTDDGRIISPTATGAIEPVPGLHGATAVAAGGTHGLALVPSRIVLAVAAPKYVFAEEGESVRLAPVFGAAASFQWYRDSITLEGRTLPVLEVPAAGFADAGHYQALATSANAALLGSGSQILVYRREVVGQGSITVAADTAAGNLEFRAAAAPGWKLDRWEGDLNGTDLRRIVTGDAGALTILARAVFVPATTITVTVAVDGRGIAVGAGVYDERATPRLWAAPEVGWRFDHWVGDLPAGQKLENPLDLEVRSDVVLRAVMAPADDPREGWFKGGTVVGAGPPLTEVVAISTGLAIKTDGTVVGAPWPGVSHAVAVSGDNLVLLADGTVRAWGENWSGQGTPPAGLTDVVGIASGPGLSLALKSNGTVVGWGCGLGLDPREACNSDSVEGWAGVGGRPIHEVLAEANLDDAIAVGAGLVLRADGSVLGWRDWPEGRSGMTATAAAGPRDGGYRIALRTDGTIAARGGYWMEDWPRPFWRSSPAGLTNVVEVAAVDGYGAIILRADGTVADWGIRFTPTSEPPLSNVVAIVTGRSLVGSGLCLMKAAAPVLKVEDGRAIQLTPQFRVAKSFQWFKDGLPLPGQNHLTLAINPIQPSDAGTYQLAAFGETNAFASPPTEVIVTTPVPAGTPQVVISGDEVLESIVVGDQAEVTLTSTLTGALLYYTLNGSDPSFEANAYSAPFTLTAGAVVRAIAYSPDFTVMREADPVVVQVVPTYTVDAQITGSGQVFKYSDRERYLVDSAVTLTAFPADGWRFKRWEGDLSGSHPEGVLVMTANKTVTAVFEAIPIYPLLVHSGGGTVSGNHDGAHREGATVTLQAAPLAGWEFAGWTGAEESAEAQISVLMDGPKELTAVFVTGIQTSVQGNGRIGLNPAVGPYAYGDTVRVTPIPDPGYYLGAWGGIAFGFPKVDFDLVVTTNDPLVSAVFQALPS